MLPLLYALLATARSSVRPQRELALENLALRQPLAILKSKTKRPKLNNADRAFWVALCGLWRDWPSALILVKPETVIGWHRKGFKLYWTSESRNRGGRPPIDREIRALIRRMAIENPTWGAPRIHGELLKLGLEVGEATVSRTMPRRRTPPARVHRWSEGHRPPDGRGATSSLHTTRSLSESLGPTRCRVEG
jgi:putative transposase